MFNVDLILTESLEARASVLNEFCKQNSSLTSRSNIKILIEYFLDLDFFFLNMTHKSE